MEKEEEEGVVEFWGERDGRYEVSEVRCWTWEEYELKKTLGVVAR